MTTKTIETKRLRIQSTQEKDGPFCLSIWLDEEMGKYLSDPPRDKADEQELNFAVGIEQQANWYPFVVVLKETGAYMGTCSLVPNADKTRWDIGYCIHKDYWRQGYATEMLQALIQFSRDQGGRICTADVAKENVASNALVRKLGFTVEKEGSFKKNGTDIVFEEYTYRLDLQ